MNSRREARVSASKSFNTISEFSDSTKPGWNILGNDEWIQSRLDQHFNINMSWLSFYKFCWFSWGVLSWWTPVKVWTWSTENCSMGWESFSFRDEHNVSEPEQWAWNVYVCQKESVLPVNHNHTPALSSHHVHLGEGLYRVVWLDRLAELPWNVFVIVVR